MSTFYWLHHLSISDNLRLLPYIVTSTSAVVGLVRLPQQTRDIYFFDRKKVITDLFVIEIKEIYVHVYTRLVIC